MFCLQIIDWLNNVANKPVEYVLKIFTSLPGVIKFLLLIAITFLSVIGFIRVASKALKTVITISSIFLIIIIIWLLL